MFGRTIHGHGNNNYHRKSAKQLGETGIMWAMLDISLRHGIKNKEISRIGYLTRNHPDK